MDFIYYGGEDGRFVGYFSDTEYTERGPGPGMASDLPWSPFSLSEINAICSDTGPPCQREQGKMLGLPPGGCPAGDRIASCTSELNQPLIATSASDCLLTRGSSWFAPCTASQ